MSLRPTRVNGRSPRRRRIVATLAGTFVLLAALALLAIPLLSVPDNARAAKDNLTEAVSALKGGDVVAARELVASAREHVDAAQGGVQGLGGDVWSMIPFVGTPVDDARRLVQALDDATAVAEIGVDLYPSVAGKQATLFRNQQVDEATLNEVIDGAGPIGRHLKSARTALRRVKGTTPVVGDTIAAQRDAAAAQTAPMADAFPGLKRMLNQLPGVLGFEGKRTYLVALLNPAELRYSGGTPLSFARMSWDEGKFELGKTFSLVDDPRLRTVLNWRKVRGNNFHRDKTRLANATLAPSWSVSGEELLRAWTRATGEEHDGLMAVDVVTMSRLLEVTGPASIPGLGKLTSDNAVETLVGSYDDYYPDPTVQDQNNAAVVAAFQTKLLAGGDYVAKARALKGAADGRHLALYMRDNKEQASFAGLGLSGDLTDPRGDYVGAFTQSTVGSKVDYFQRRSIALEVDLGEDGTATNQLDVTIRNDTPPFVPPEPDPRTGYFTRWSTLAASVFVPDQAEVQDFSVGEEPWGGRTLDFFKHRFASDTTIIPPGGSTRVSASYRVPRAAKINKAGVLIYRLAMDPQGTVNPAAVEVKVHLPDGYRASALPVGWSAEGSTLTFATSALGASQEWEFSMEADD